jgi:hypothetical protein
MEYIMAIDNEAVNVLQQALDSMPCTLELSTYNDAVSMQSRLKKYIRLTQRAYHDMKKYETPYDDIEITLIKPRILRFTLRQPAKMQPDMPWGPLLDAPKPDTE